MAGQREPSLDGRTGRPGPGALRARIQEGAALLGTFVKSSDPTIAELLASAGFDVLIADLEHSTLSVSDLHDMVRAGEVWNVPTIARIGPEAIPEIGRILESGVAGLQVGAVERADTLEELRRAIQFRPAGVRGSSVSHRAAEFGRVSADEYTRLGPEAIAVIAQVETVEGVNRLPELLRSSSAPDCWFVGAVDLSCDLGFPGELEHNVVRNAIDGISEQVAAAGQRLGMFAANERSAVEWRARGATLVALASDISLLAQQAEGVVSAWRAATAITAIDGN